VLDINNFKYVGVDESDIGKYTHKECGKCGAPPDEIEVEHHDEMEFINIVERIRTTVPEHLCKTCETCGFHWKERTKDFKPIPSEEEAGLN